MIRNTLLATSLIATQVFGSCLYMESFTTKNDGPISQQELVESECKVRCSEEGGVWSGYWNSKGDGNSVCQCFKLQKFSTVNDDPIWDNGDANNKCPERCSNEEGSWTGGWWTTTYGKNSVCECTKKSISVVCDENGN